MKKSILLTALAFAALGCSKTEVKPVEDAPAQISWNAVVGKPSTKAPVTGTTFDQSHVFTTYAFFNAAGTTWPNNASLYIDNQEISYYENAVTPFVAKSWHSNTVNYWPKQGSLTFFSYSFAEEKVDFSGDLSCDATNGLKLTGYDVNVTENQNKDFMVADIQTAQKQNTTNASGATAGVPTIFRHALTWIVGFNIKTAEDYKGSTLQAGSKVIEVSSVKICNAYSKGDYQMTTDITRTESWANQTNVSSYDFSVATGASEEVTKTGASLQCAQQLFMPQTFDAPEYQFTGNTIIDKAIERQKKEYIDAVEKVGHIELTYTIKTYTDGTHFSEETVKEYIALADFASNKENTDGYWKINRKITYNITIDLSANIIYWDPIVEEWDPEEKTITL